MGIRDLFGKRRDQDKTQERDLFFEEILQYAFIGIIALDIDRSVIEANQKSYEMLGYSAEDATTPDWLYHITPEPLQEKVIGQFAHAVHTERPTQFESELICRDGSILPVQLLLHPRVGEDGNLIEIYLFIFDITRQKQYERRLIAARQLAEQYLDIARNIIVSIDLNGNVVMINQTGLDLLEYSREELIGRNWFDLCIPADIRARMKEVFKTISDDHQSFHSFENEVITKSGKTRLISWKNSFITTSDNDLSELVSSGSDITELREAQDQLKSVKEQFAEAMKATLDGLWDWNLQDNSIYFSPEWKKMLGYEDADIPNDFSVWNKLTDAEGSRRFWEMQQKVVNREVDRFIIEFQMIHKDGHPVDILSRAKAIFDEQGKPLRLIGTHVDISRQKENEKALARSEAKYRQLIDTATDAIYLIDREGKVVEANPASCSSLGYTYEEMLSNHIWDFNPTFIPEYFKSYWDAVPVDEIQLIQTTHTRKDGTSIPVEISAKKFILEDEVYYYGIARDISARKKQEQEKLALQSQFSQVMKMDSIGRLAGGIANDYNNMLSVIMGHVDIAMQHVEHDDPIFTQLLEIQKAADKSVELTRQLQAFARKQPSDPRRIDLCEVITNMVSMLERLVGNEIRLVWRTSGETAPVKADPVQIDQILTNLVLNAAQSIKDTGTITIVCESVEIDEASKVLYDRDALGHYHVLSVQDTGRGIPPEDRDHIFEPFYTSKQANEGNGLGLSTVYGIVKQNNGFIKLYSEPGIGSIFRVYLPADRDSVKDTASPDAEGDIMDTGNERVLIVEDEPTILELEHHILKKLGYQVFTAPTPEEALKIADSQEIDILVTDIIMPGMNGKALSEKIIGIYPECKVLFLSGYTSDVISGQGITTEGVNFLQKPFTVTGFTRMVKSIISRP